MSPQEKLEALKRMGKMPIDGYMPPLRRKFLDSLNNNNKTEGPK